MTDLEAFMSAEDTEISLSYGVFIGLLFEFRIHIIFLLSLPEFTNIRRFIESTVGMTDFRYRFSFCATRYRRAILSMRMMQANIEASFFYAFVSDHHQAIWLFTNC